MKLLLLDLDGTVREPKSAAKFINEPEDQRLIVGVEEAVKRYSDWLIVGITNQGGVAAGHKSLESAIAEQRVTIDLLPQLECIYFCPDFEGLQAIRCHYTDGNWRWLERENHGFGGFRKPSSGMLNLAIDDCISRPKEVLMVGDRAEDEQAAAAAGVPFMWAETWRTGTVPL